MNPNALIILKSIPGTGLVWSSGILSEIDDITAFHSSDALAKPNMLDFTGIRVILEISLPRTAKCQKPEIPIFAAIEAANSIRKYIPAYADFYT